jgi:hypothetical protein
LRAARKVVFDVSVDADDDDDDDEDEADDEDADDEEDVITTNIAGIGGSSLANVRPWKSSRLCSW